MTSLAEKVALRRKLREQERTFVLPIPGWEDMFAGRYRPLPFEDIFDLQQRYPEQDSSEGVLSLRAATLARACVELLKVDGEDENGKPKYVSLGCGWTAKGVNEHLNLAVPDDATPYDVLSAVLNGVTGGTEIYVHFEMWDARQSQAAKDEDEAIRGNSEAGSAVEALSISQ